MLLLTLWFASAPALLAQLPIAPAREYIYFGDRRIAIEDPQSNCHAVLDLFSNFTWPAQGANVSLTAPTGCVWTLTNHQPDVVNAATGPASGTGNAPITIWVNAHTGPGGNPTRLPRMGSLSVRGQMIRFIQGAQALDLNVQFSDVPNDDITGPHGIVNYVALMKDRRISVGCGGNNFCPGSTLNRQEIAVFLVRAALYDPQRPGGAAPCADGAHWPYNTTTNTCGFTYSTTPHFSDMWDPGNVYFPYIQKLQDINAVAACQFAGMFCPTHSVTRFMMAEMVIKSMAYRGAFPVNFSYPSQPFFDDVPPGNAAFRFVQKLREQGVTAGSVLPTTYRGSDLLSRQQMAIFLVRAMFAKP